MSAPNNITLSKIRNGTHRCLFAFVEKKKRNTHTHTHTHIYIYIYIYTQVKELKRTHRFSVTLSFAPRRSSDRTLFNEEHTSLDTHRSNASRLTYLKYQTPAQECTKAMGWWLHIYTKPKKNIKCIQNSILTIRVPYMIAAVWDYSLKYEIFFVQSDTLQMTLWAPVQYDTG